MAMLGWICNIAVIGCAIYVGVLAIQRKQVALGVICILCPIVALIIGWTKTAELGIKKNFLLVFTILFVLSIVLNGMSMRVTTGT
jgi:hypothetical protein